MYMLERAFRLFFLGAVGFAVISMAVWLWQWNFASQFNFGFSGLNPIYWHAHEMIFGYALATVTGFILTAAMNWTRMNSAAGKPLLALFLLWFGARLGFIFDLPLALVALLDLLFTLGLFFMFAYPNWKKRLRKQIGLGLAFLGIFIANFAFYWSLENSMPSWLSTHNILLIGMFLVLSINLVMIRRLVPFFTEKSLQIAPPKNNRKLDLAVLIGFLAVLLAVIFSQPSFWWALAALPTAALLFLREYWWYRTGIWRQVLLWPLHISHLFMGIGMLMFGLAGFKLVTESIAIHALAAGGIGLLCSAIVARISLGHTQRSIYDTPPGLVWAFVMLTIAAIARVILPAIWPSFYQEAIVFSQIFWSLGFAWIFVLYYTILAKPAPIVPPNIRL